jgi:hypothetical protein
MLLNYLDWTGSDRLTSIDGVVNYSATAYDYLHFQVTYVMYAGCSDSAKYRYVSDFMFMGKKTIRLVRNG